MNMHALSQTVLFRGATPGEVEAMLSCLHGETRTYPKGAVIFHAGDPVSSVGLILSGSVSVEIDDVWGNKTILDHLKTGQVFAEAYACVPGEPLMTNVVAAEQTQVLLLDVGRMLHICSNACGFHNKLIRNLLLICAQKNLSLSRRSIHTGARSIRGRLLSYLSFQALSQGSREFDIPFNRQQLADYLNVDRSAMSAELGKMQKEGLLRADRSHFVLYDLENS